MNIKYKYKYKYKTYSFPNCYADLAVDEDSCVDTFNTPIRHTDVVREQRQSQHTAVNSPIHIFTTET